jgi:RNA polymerase sigma-70 factor (ECF subfamily)
LVRQTVEETERRLKDLMLAARAGDAAAYRTLLRELAAHLRAFYRRRLGANRLSDAEDLVQETLIAVHSKANTYDASQPLTPWLHAIARYKLIDLFRRSKDFKVSLDDVETLVAHSDYEAALAGRDIELLLAKLPKRSRDLVRGVKIEGLSTRDAAHRSGMSETAVKVAVHRAMRALTAMLKRESE